MSTFNYSKWDNIELSDDEDDVHPNIDRESWFRMKHRSRVEREEKEEKDKKKINDEIAKNNLRMKEINKILSKSSASADDDSDDDLEDIDGLQAELRALHKANTEHQTRLENYEKNKKWNVDNMCHVVEERTIVNENVGESTFSSSGFACPSDAESIAQGVKKSTFTDSPHDVNVPVKEMAASSVSSEAITPSAASVNSVSDTKSKPQPQPEDPLNSVSVSMLSYHEFTEKYADVVEQFMSIESIDRSKEFLLQNGSVLLQENASNYLLLASLEDEMNGFHEKMKLVARQSQIISNIAELAKSLQRHPGNVIIPFFTRLDNKEMYHGFMDGVNEFVKRIQLRAIEKRKEIDEERAQEARESSAAGDDATDLSTMPREERLGPGGLDPLEVFETLPTSIQEAFESREKEKLQTALMAMPPEEAEYHLKRCVDSGLWNA